MAILDIFKPKKKNNFAMEQWCKQAIKKGYEPHQIARIAKKQKKNKKKSLLKTFSQIWSEMKEASKDFSDKANQAQRDYENLTKDLNNLDKEVKNANKRI